MLACPLLPDGRVLIVGDSDSDVGGYRFDSAEVWDPATSTFSPAGSLATQAGHYPSAALLPDGRVFIGAGCPQHICDSVEVWDPGTDTFRPTGSLSVPRLRHTTTALPDGRVLVVGGWGSWDGDVRASAEVWEPGPSGGEGQEQGADIVAPVEVTARIADYADGCSGTDYEGPFEDSGADAALWTCSTDTGLPWSASDLRLEGTVTRTVEEVTFEVGDVTDVYIASNAFSIENDGGTWRERPRTWLLPDGISTFDWLPQEVFVLEGSGDYEDLVAVPRVRGLNEMFCGFIVDSRWMPPPPENALTE